MARKPKAPPPGKLRSSAPYLAEGPTPQERLARLLGQAARYGWLSSLEEGKAQARRSGKPLLVVLRCVP